MADTVKVLAQSAPSAATETTLYTCASSNGTTVSTIMVCNTTASGDTFRIAVVPGGGSASTVNWVYYNVSIAANETFAATVGITLENTDVIRIYSTNGYCSFSVFGIEL